MVALDIFRSVPTHEPRWFRLSAFGAAAFIALHVLVGAALSNYGFDELLGNQPLERNIQRNIDQERLGPGKVPGYPIFLLLTEMVTGRGSLASGSIIVQILVAWATMIGLFFVSRRATASSALAVLAVALVSFNGLWVEEVIEQRETFLYAAILIALVGFTVYMPMSSRWYLFSAGTTCALAVLTRLTGVVLLPAVAFLLLSDWRTGASRFGLSSAVVCVLSASVPVLSWYSYQQVTFGKASMSSDNGTNLIKGNNHALSATYPFVDVDRLSPVLVEPIKEAAIARGSDPNRELIRLSLKFVMQSPLEALALIPRKLAAFFVPLHFPLGTGTIVLTESNEWRIENYEARSITSADGIMALPGILAFFFGAMRWHTLSKSARLTILLVGFTAVLHVITFAQTRFRLPYDPILALLFVQMLSSRLRRTTGSQCS